MWGSIWDLCWLSLLSWRKFWIRATVSTGSKILLYSRDEDLLYSLIYCGENKLQAVQQTGTGLVSVIQGLATPIEVVSALPFTDTLWWQFAACQHYLVTSSLVQHQAGSSCVSRNLGASTLQSATIIEDTKIFTMIRWFVTKLVTAGPVTCAINVFTWHLSQTQLATVQAM